MTLGIWVLCQRVSRAPLQGKRRPPGCARTCPAQSLLCGCLLGCHVASGGDILLSEDLEFPSHSEFVLAGWRAPKEQCSSVRLLSMRCVPSQVWEVATENPHCPLHGALLVWAECSFHFIQNAWKPPWV